MDFEHPVYEYHLCSSTALDRSLGDKKVTRERLHENAHEARNKSYSIIKSLGAGAHGEVVLASRNSDGKLVACKVLRRHHSKEIRLADKLRRVKHIVQARGLLHDCELLTVVDGVTRASLKGTVLVLDYCSLGSLGHLVRAYGRRAADIPVPFLWSALFDLAHALTGMHRRGVCHRDLQNNENILLSHEDDEDLDSTYPQLVICDFGTAMDREEYDGSNPALVSEPESSSRRGSAERAQKAIRWAHRFADGCRNDIIMAAKAMTALVRRSRIAPRGSHPFTRVLRAAEGGDIATGDDLLHHMRTARASQEADECFQPLKRWIREPSPE